MRKIVLCGLVFLVLASVGYYSGVRRALHEVAGDRGGVSESKAEASEFSALTTTPEKKPERKPIKKTGKAKKPTLPLKKLLPLKLQRFREAEEFIERIPEMEQELLAQHPLLARALELEKEIREGYRALGKRVKPSARKGVDDRFRATIAENLPKLDAYLALLDDPEYAPFVEDGLRHGNLAKDVPGNFAWQWRRYAGLVLDDVEFPDPAIDDLGEYKKAFERFASGIKAEAGKLGTGEHAPSDERNEAMARAMLSRKAFILRYYKQSILPEEWVEVYWRHSRTLMEITNPNWATSPPPEVVEALEQLRSSSIVKPGAINEEF